MSQDEPAFEGRAHRRLLFGSGVIGGALAITYLRALRPRILNWGATPEEIGRVMPGDDLLAKVSLQTTRVITIDATPDFIWPWLVQMGPKPRAGVYTYDWIERLLGIDIKNSDQLLPEFQHLEVGEFFALNKKGQGLRVRRVEPQRSLVLQWEPAQSTWEFALYPSGATTRLVSRNRIPGSGIQFWLGMVLFMEPGSLVMERKMLQGIRDRAEALARSH
jgi:hypothetical protein